MWGNGTGRSELRSALRLYAIWAPAALGSSLLAWEIPIVTALVSRAVDGSIAVAILGISLSILFIVNSPSLAITPLIVATSPKYSSQSLLRYAFIVGSLGTVAILSLAAAPISPILIGLPAHFGEPVRTCLAGFASAPLAVALRRYQHGFLIDRKKTPSIAPATMVRLAASCGIALILGVSDLVTATAIAGIGLSAGAWTEVAYLAIVVRSLSHHESAATCSEMGPLVALHAQLTSTVLLNMCPSFIITVVLAHSDEAELSLIVWPALYGLLSLTTGTLSDLESIGAMYLRRSSTERPLRLFAHLIAGATLTMGLFATLTPATQWYLTDFTGIPPGPAALGASWAPILAIVPGLWCLRAYARAKVIFSGQTAFLTWAAAANVAAMIMLGVVLPMGGLPGVSVAAILVAVAPCLEALVLRMPTYPPLHR